MPKIDIDNYIEQSGMRKARFGGYEPEDVHQAMEDLCADYEQHLTAMTSELRTLRQENDALRRHAQGLVMQNQTLSTQNATLAGQVDKLQSYRANLETQFSTVKERSHSLTNQVDMLRLKNSDLTRENKELTERCEEANSALRVKGRAHDQARQQVIADRDKVIADAEAEAARIRQQARDDADQILKDTNLKAEAIDQLAREQAIAQARKMVQSATDETREIQNAHRLRLQDLKSRISEMEKTRGEMMDYLAKMIEELQKAQEYASQNAPLVPHKEELAEAVKLTHQMGKRLYLTCNTLMNNEEADLLPRYLAEVHEMGVDAAIVSDIGVLMAAHRAMPELELHISTQAGVTNWLTAAELHRLGAKRVVLARELPLTEIEELCRRIPRELEVEVFVHGAMCMSVSGRCLLSQYLTGRDANRGACTQPCRWKYALMEEKRPGQYYPVEEDGHYSYILNAKDLCLIEYLDKLAKAGVHSFKIEGRAKSAYYTAVTAGAYRAATDLMWRDPEHYRCPDWLREEVTKVSHRDYTTGFLFGPPEAGQCYETGGYIRRWEVAGVVTGYDAENRRLLCVQRNKFAVGQPLELVLPLQGVRTFTPEKLYDAEGRPVNCVPHAAAPFMMDYPEPLPQGTLLRMTVE